MDFILERLNESDKTRFVIDSEEFFFCGRGHANKINCHSVLVSRKHCMFHRRNDELYVTDFGNSNGIFINGALQESQRSIKLHQNDIIGIGTANNDPGKNDLYTFRVLCIVKPVSSNEAVSVAPGSSSNTAFNNDKPQEVPAFSTNRVVGEKCKSDSTDCDKSIPCKIKCTKIKEHDSRINLLKESVSESSYNNNKNLNSHNSHNTDNLVGARTDNVHMKENHDIEIIHTSLKITSKDAKMTKDIKMTKNVKEYNTENSSLLAPKYLNNNNKLNLNSKTFQYPTSHKNCKNNEIMDISSDEDVFDDDSKKNRNKIYSAENILNNINKTNDSLNITRRNSIHINNEVIKKNNVKRRMDNDEKAVSVNCKKTFNESSIKVKKIKQESKTRFSEIDIIDISDDEDGLFPYSQLFDSNLEENTECKIKTECDSNDDQNTEKNDRPDMDDEVVILSDSEDEDNPWLERLSRSQIIKEENENDVIIKDELDLGVWEEDDIVADVIQLMPQPIKVFNKNDTPYELDTNVDDRNKDEDNLNKDEDNISEDNNNNADLMKKDAIIDDVDLSKEPEPSLVSADINKEKADVEQDADKLDKPDKSDKEKVSVESPKPKSIKERKSVTTNKMLIPVIEPPNLSKRRRHTDHSKDRTSKISEKKSPLKSKTEETEKSTSKLKTKHKDNSYSKEHRKEHRKERHKEKPKTPTDSSEEPKPGPSISKDEKRMIKQKRKEKLKEIAVEEKKQAAKNDQNVQRRIAKPRAKISLKNRGDFLIEQEPPCTSKSLPDKSTRVPKSSTSSSKQFPAQADIHKKSTTFNTEKNQAKDVSKVTTNDTLLQQTTEALRASTFAEDPFIDATTSDSRRDRTKDVFKDTVNSTSSQPSLHLKPMIRLINISDVQVPKYDTKMAQGWHRIVDKEKKHKKETKRNNKNVCEVRDRSTERALMQQKTKETPNDLKSNLAQPCVKRTKTKKKVTFAEKPLIKEYEIDSHNNMKKLKGKDAPIPTDKLTKKSTVCVNWVPKLEEFLLRIFMWNPVWLDEQRTLNKEPPIVTSSEIQPMKLSYDSYKQYYEVAMPLLLHEIWYTMTKDFEVIEGNMQRAIMICSVVQNSVTRIPIPSTNLFLTTMMIEVLVDRRGLEKPMHPTYGDLVVLQLNIKRQCSQIFAYVTNMHQTTITEFTYYNKDLRQYVQNPCTVITYTLLTRSLDFDIPVDRLHRVRTVMYLRANMRMVQALQYLPQSPLVSQILNPKIEDYHLPPTPKPLSSTALITKNNLNAKQLEAVFRVSQIVLNKEPKLCFIQGPPGTGKSKVIANLVTQILYDESVNNKKPLKILVCAPSNAATDEVALRLLNIRSSLKGKRKGFKMVRIGRPETMHPLIRTISVTDLAKRNLREKAAKSNSPHESEDISLIQAQINSLNIQSASSLTDKAKKLELENKLNIAQLDYELKKCGKTMEEFTPKERIRYQRLQEKLILTNADIITCTLSSCYTNLMESTFGGNKERISVCIVDEATQSCEAETLIPLMLGVNTLVLVGDPNQLPATILSQRAKRLGLDRSIFSRIQSVFASQPHNPIIMLDTQYRMVDSISYWPNRYFYGGKLKNGFATDWNTSFPFHGYRVLDHNSAQNNDKFSNSNEAEFVANMIYAMLIFPKWEEDATISLGVLTPYNNQRNLVMQRINEKIRSVPDKIRKRITFEVNTVDGFQGQERDVIIMSCVRSQGIGFLSDKQRLCVALTRAKNSLILCGNFNTFKKDQMWQTLLTDARTRGHLCSVDANATPAIIKKFIMKENSK